MNTTASVRRSRREDIPEIERLLSAAQLPLEGARRAFDIGFVAEVERQVVGAVALECFADGALLRSLVIDPEQRGTGLGKSLTDAAIREAGTRGLSAVYLLTTTAEAFFPKLGFVRTGREAVPLSVQESIEFQSACPASAVAMVRLLG